MSTHIEDQRRHDFFIIDNEVISEYMPRIGVYGFAVYSYLVYRANETRTCYPSFGLIAEELGISRPTVNKAIQALEDAGLLQVQHRFDSEGGKRSNLYVILPISKTAPVNEVDDPLVNEVNQGGKSDLHITRSTEQDPLSSLKGAREFDETDNACARELLKVSNFPKKHIAETLADLRADFPFIDAVKVCKDYRVWCEETPYKRPRSGLRTFFSRAEPSQTPTNGKSSRTHSSKGKARLNQITPSKTGGHTQEERNGRTDGYEELFGLTPEQERKAQQLLKEHSG